MKHLKMHFLYNLIIKKIIIFFLAFLFYFDYALGQVKQSKIGDNPEVMSAPLSTVLELESTDKALLLSRVANTAAITNPVNGMIIFDLSEKCIKGYQDGVWTGCNFNDFVSVTGKTWMNKNLGASRVATTATDFLAYGDYYQWGRGTDGHEKVNSSAYSGYPINATTTAQSSSDIPGHGLYINHSTDWRSSRNDNLWQGVNGINNPCPSGFRVPTISELQAEYTAYGMTSSSTAGYNSPFRFPHNGNRTTSGSFASYGNTRFLWTSTIGTVAGRSIYFALGTTETPRSVAMGIRCIKD